MWAEHYPVTLNINQLHFVTRSAVPNQFYCSFSYRSETFSVHLVARLIRQRHFVAMYACSEMCALHTFIAMVPREHESPAGAGPAHS